MANKFKVGDKVRVVLTGCPVSGIETEIVSIDNEIGAYKIKEGNIFGSDSSLELISEPQYTQLHPKVGDRFRVVKSNDAFAGNNHIYLPVGHIATVQKTDCGKKWAVVLKDIQGDQILVSRVCLTTEYLEPVEEPEREWAQADHLVNLQKYMKTWHVPDEFEVKPKPFRHLMMEAFGEKPIKQNKKLTIMQTITTALKRVLSPQLQKFYKVGYIDTGLTLTNSGRTAYIEALFQNVGDHTKALAEMEADADEVIAAEKE